MLIFVLLWLSNDIMNKQKPFKLFIILIISHIVSFVVGDHCFDNKSPNEDILNADLSTDI